MQKVFKKIKKNNKLPRTWPARGPYYFSFPPLNVLIIKCTDRSEAKNDIGRFAVGRAELVVESSSRSGQQISQVLIFSLFRFFWIKPKEMKHSSVHHNVNTDEMSL
jgi:hypothetical protein